jgi:hypothetical protein
MNGVIGKTPKTPTVHTAYILNRVDAPYQAVFQPQLGFPQRSSGVEKPHSHRRTSSPQLPQNNQGELLGSQLAVVVAWEKTDDQAYNQSPN